MNPCSQYQAEIDRLKEELALVTKHSIERGKAIVRVRELCAFHAYEYNGKIYVFTEQVLRALDKDSS